MNRRIALSTGLLAALVLACGGGGGGTTDTGTATDKGGPTDPGPGDVVADVPVTPDLPVDKGGTPDTTPPTDVPKETTPVDVAIPDGTPACIAVTTGPTCREAAACAVQCDDTTYQDGCKAQLDATGKEATDKILACLKTADCVTAFESEEFSTCADTSCSDVLEPCFVGTAKCKDVWACRKDCDASDPGCPMKCFGLASAAEQDLWITYKDCVYNAECAATDLRPNGWPTQKCEDYAVGHFCSNEKLACIPYQ